MRTAIDVTLDGEPGTADLLVMATDIRDAIVHSQRTLDGLLALARSHAGSHRRDRTDLADVVTEILETAGKEAAEHGVELIRVTNTGTPLDSSTVDDLFTPFVRGPATRTRADGGAGLGLSIVRAVVEAHHGTLSVVAAASGGLDITVELPVS